MPSVDRSYDVAISFLHQDEPLAVQLHHRLSEGLKVFVYSKAQEKLAGNDGLEEFRQAFRQNCRLIVVLYRDGWGQTPWTRIEETAIKERCLADGWDVLLFVTLDKTCTVPKWVPETRVRLSLSHYGFDELVGAIKHRVEEQGGSVKKIDALVRAQLEQEEAKFQSARRQYLDSMQGVQDLQAEAQRLYGEIRRLSDEVMANTQWRFSIGSDAQQCVLAADRVSLVASLSIAYTNRAETGKLDVLEYQGRMLPPGERGIYPFGGPRVLERHHFLPDVTYGMSWRWKTEEDPRRFMNSDELADYCMQRFLALMGRAIRGDLPPWDIDV